VEITLVSGLTAFLAMALASVWSASTRLRSTRSGAGSSCRKGPRRRSAEPRLGRKRAIPSSFDESDNVNTAFIKAAGSDARPETTTRIVAVLRRRRHRRRQLRLDGASDTVIRYYLDADPTRTS